MHDKVIGVRFPAGEGWEFKRCAGVDFTFVLEREDATNGPVTLVAIFAPNYS
jgi:hypothetical protein